MTYELIASQTLGSSAAYIEFTSISATFDDLMLVCSLRSDRASSTVDNIRLRFNGASTDTNLSVRYLSGSGSGASSFVLSSFAYIGNATASGSTASTFGNAECYIPNYAGSTNKSFSAIGLNEANATLAYIDAVAGLWSDTSAITATKLFPGNGSNWVSGSSAYLYGISHS